jgi:hypothetical protein
VPAYEVVVAAAGNAALAAAVAGGSGPVDLNLRMLMDRRLEIALDWNRS